MCTECVSVRVSWPCDLLVYETLLQCVSQTLVDKRVADEGPAFAQRCLQLRTIENIHFNVPLNSDTDTTSQCCALSLEVGKCSFLIHPDSFKWNYLRRSGSSFLITCIRLCTYLKVQDTKGRWKILLGWVLLMIQILDWDFIKCAQTQNI